jgi:hypothetical protein
MILFKVLLTRFYQINSRKLSKNHLQGIHFTADFFMSLSFKKITAPPSIIGSIDYFNILDHFIGDYLTLKSTYQDLFLAYFE